MAVNNREAFSKRLIDIGQGHIRIQRVIPEGISIPVINKNRVKARLGPEAAKKALPWLDDIAIFANGLLFLDDFADHDVRRVWRAQNIDADQELREFYQNTNQLSLNLITLFSRGIDRISYFAEKDPDIFDPENDPFVTELAAINEETRILLTGKDSEGREIDGKIPYGEQTSTQKINTVTTLVNFAFRILSEFSDIENP